MLISFLFLLNIIIVGKYWPVLLHSLPVCNLSILETIHHYEIEQQNSLIFDRLQHHFSLQRTL